MLKIRLQRVGRKNIPVFRVVLTDSKNSTKSGRFLEVLGSYDPVNDVKEIKTDRVKELIKNGAQLSTTLHNHLVSKKVIEGKKKNALPRRTPIKKEVPAVEPAAPAVAATAEAKPAEKPREAAPAEEAKAETPATA